MTCLHWLAAQARWPKLHRCFGASIIILELRIAWECCEELSRLRGKMNSGRFAATLKTGRCTSAAWGPTGFRTLQDVVTHKTFMIQVITKRNARFFRVYRSMAPL